MTRHTWTGDRTREDTARRDKSERHLAVFVAPVPFASSPSQLQEHQEQFPFAPYSRGRGRRKERPETCVCNQVSPLSLSLYYMPGPTQRRQNFSTSTPLPASWYSPPKRRQPPTRPFCIFRVGLLVLTTRTIPHVCAAVAAQAQT